ncbi:MAG: helix-turn-helix transcriptional regulator [Gammaproteobacteria bacterium]|nr:helix-turn-helix transcriptional regulator [Gammaproteobacteria bacterium]
MRYATDYIATRLRNARDAKGLSQRALSELAGVPQGHISKIENGVVDLRVSSLVELARVLDLELMLVPRKSLPAVSAITRSTEGMPRRLGDTAATRKELNRLQNNLGKVLHKYPANIELAQSQRFVRDLKNFRFSAIDLDKLRDANRAVDMFIETEDAEGLHRTLIEVKNMRNAAAHSTAASMPEDAVRPAYSLEEDGHGD